MRAFLVFVAGILFQVSLTKIALADKQANPLLDDDAGFKHDPDLHLQYLVDIIDLPKHASPMVILERLTQAQYTAPPWRKKVDFSTLSYFLHLSKDYFQNNCNFFEEWSDKVSDMLYFSWLDTDYFNVLNREGKAGRLRAYLNHFGGLRYGHCARLLNETFKTAPSEGERDLDQIFAYTMGSESTLEECAQLSQEELFARATRLSLKNSDADMRRLFAALNKMRGIQREFPDSSREAAIDLAKLASKHCDALEAALEPKLNVLSLAYAFGGDDLRYFQPRLRKLLEYRRVCISIKDPWAPKVLERIINKHKF